MKTHRISAMVNSSSRWTSSVAAFLLLAASVASSCGEKNPAREPESNGSVASHSAPDGHAAERVVLTAESRAANGILVETAARRDLRPSFRVPAHVGFNREAMAHVGSPVKGRVSDLPVKLGDEVAKGAPLLTIESPELGEAQSDYLQKRSATQTAAPPVELAKSTYERAKGLYDQTQGIPLTEVQKRESEYRTGQAALQAAKSAEQAAENKLHLLGMSQESVRRLGESGEIDPHFAVHAPIAGQVIEREVTLGELVGPEREALLVIADMSKLWVLADVPETRLRELSVGASARVLLGVEQAHWCTGSVSFISPALDPSTRSVRVRIDVSDRHPELRPGVFAQVDITSNEGGTGELTNVVAIPESSVQSVEGESVVFVPLTGADGTFEKRVVRVGPSVGGMLPVRSGLAEGESFVAAGSFVLKAELTKASAGHED